MSTPTTPPAAPEKALPALTPNVDYYTLGTAFAEVATFEQLAHLLLGLQDGIAATGEMGGLMYAIMRCEAADLSRDFNALAAGLTEDKGE